MAAAIDLRPDRNLLDPCFETYRLDSRALGVAETALEARVSCPELGPGQFGLCHVQLQLIHNALIADDFNPGSFFYFTNGELHRLRGIEGSAPHDPGSPETSIAYILRGSATTGSFQFVSEKHAIILEPKGTLVLLFTGSRETTQKFEEISSFELGLDDAVVLNALEVATENDKITTHLLICSITDSKDKNRGISRLDWVVLEGPQNEGLEWRLSYRHQLHGEAVPKFTKLLCNGSDSGNLRLLVCADCRYRTENGSEVSNKRGEDLNVSTPLYSYIQDEAEITVNFALEAETSKNDIKVSIYSDRIQVRIKDIAVVDGKLHDNVDPTSSVWCILDSKLEITLVKRSGARWPRLLVNDDRGEEIFDPAYVEEVHHRLRHLTTAEQEPTSASSIIDSERGENCDEPPDEFHVEIFSFTEKGLERVGFSDLTGREHVMNIWTASGPQMVLRHDVDGLVWEFFVEENGSVRAQHVNTLSAFGYVVASKRDKAFLAGCIEAGYSALVDAKNNVFIYEHQNKGKPKKTVLKEYLVPLRPGATRVIGGRMLADRLFLLTSDSLFAITLPK